MTRGGRKSGRSGRLVVGGGGWLIAVVLGPARPLIAGECLQDAFMDGGNLVLAQGPDI